MADHLAFGFMIFPRSVEQTHRVARRAEQLGFSWIGLADSPTVYQESYLHQLEALRATTRINVGPVVTHFTLRHPLIVGNLLATLNEIGGGRTIGALGTGNSGARGVGIRPARVNEIGQAIDAIRGYWSGVGGVFGESRIPSSGIARRGCPLIVAADGQGAARLAGARADGLLYGGTMEPAVLDRRVAAGRGRPDQRVWIGPAVSLGRTVADVLDDMGALIVAMANRAFRGDLRERGIPQSLHADVREMWEKYDYAFHADTTRPRNLQIVSPALAEYLVEHFVIWGDTPRWQDRLAFLRARGCDGVMFILGHGNADEVVEQIAARLTELGYLPEPKPVTRQT
jgi:5,10-methylenetetrahydromethanopterin reductase